MTRIALLATFLAAGWSPVARCLATSIVAKPASSCHGGATKPVKAPMSHCEVMACCQSALLPAAVAPSAPKSVFSTLAAVATLILVPPAPPAEFSPAASPGPPGLLLVVSRLGRAPPIA